MNIGLPVFQQLVHLNLNLAVLVLFAWALLGRGRGPKTSLMCPGAYPLRRILDAGP